MTNKQKKFWLASPVVIALITSILTLIGGYLTGFIEHDSATKLEKQKFEYSLIEKSLITDGGVFLGPEETHRQEATKRLLFLVDIGIIKVLDGEAIKAVAEDPDRLPSRP